MEINTYLWGWWVLQNNTMAHGGREEPKIVQKFNAYYLNGHLKLLNRNAKHNACVIFCVMEVVKVKLPLFANQTKLHFTERKRKESYFDSKVALAFNYYRFKIVEKWHETSNKAIN